MRQKIFSLGQARLTLSLVKELLESAEDDLEPFRCGLKSANDLYDELEQALFQTPAPAADTAVARELKKAGESLSAEQRDYLERLNYWVGRVNETGVILRDLHAGLIDFPSRRGDLTFFLCWRLSEPDIQYWHLAGDGFAGRKPLAALAEFL